MLTYTFIAEFNVPTNLVFVGDSNVPSVVRAKAEVVALCNNVNVVGDTTAKLPFQSRSNAEQLEDFKTIPSFRSKLTSPELRMSVNKMMGRCDYYLYIMQIAKDLNNKLLKQLNNKEF
mgnify:CR=1 FL=1